MPTGPYAAATTAIYALVTRKVRPLSSLEAAFHVAEAMSKTDAQAVLDRLIAQRYLCQTDADVAQLLAQRLGVEVQWLHMPYRLVENGWKEEDRDLDTHRRNYHRTIVPLCPCPLRGMRRGGEGRLA